ncbi:MAG TPA: alkaline phosphatase family protein [Gemmatimonadaceae bacterium]|nr:alkaline phosphatase family protein [Gemmatimonadaceae bacterium]
MAVVVLLADGVRPDTLAGAIDAGALPALARLRDEGGLHAVSTVFPSVTGPAYAPFLMGRFPGPVGLPGLRWFDRERTACSLPDYTRSYVGYQMRSLDRDLDADAPTIFELAPSSIAALSVITRGLPAPNRIGALTLRSALRAARTHFSGNVAGWLRIDREIADEVVRRVAQERPAYTYAAFTGVDKVSHARGHGHPMVIEALRIVDDAAARIRADAEREGRWQHTHLWIVSDHGHSPVRRHEDLAGLFTLQGHRVVAHPWVITPFPETAVMVSGNAMAHVFLEVRRRRRPWWPALAPRWGTLVDLLLARPSVDLLLLPLDTERCEVRSRRGEVGIVSRAAGFYSYFPAIGDPLGVGRALQGVTADEAYDATAHTDYPDSIVQIAHLAASPRAGDIILSAARDWDFRARYEPIPHVSSHGALHREHMTVPLLVNRPLAGVPRRTTDVMPSTLVALGLPVPGSLDGTSFL